MLRQFGAQFLAQLVVEIGERLVEQHQAGILDDGARQRGALLLAARQAERRALEIGRQLQQLAPRRCTSRSIFAASAPATRSGEAMFS